MLEIVLGVVNLGLLVAFILYVRETNKEKAKLVNALIAKTPEQARDLDMVDKVQVKVQPQTTQAPDLVPLENVSDDEFEEHIQSELNAE